MSSYLSSAHSCPTLWDPMNHSTPGFPLKTKTKTLCQQLFFILSVATSKHYSAFCLYRYGYSGHFI